MKEAPSYGVTIRFHRFTAPALEQYTINSLTVGIQPSPQPTISEYERNG